MLYTIAPEECQSFVRKLARKIDITSDLPAHIFLDQNLVIGSLSGHFFLTWTCLKVC